MAAAQKHTAKSRWAAGRPRSLQYSAAGIGARILSPKTPKVCVWHRGLGFRPDSLDSNQMQWVSSNRKVPKL